VTVYLPQGSPDIPPVRTPPTVLWRSSAVRSGFIGDRESCVRVWLAVQDLAVMITSGQYTYEPYGGWWEGPFTPSVDVHDPSTGARRWGAPGTPLSYGDGTVTVADGRQDVIYDILSGVRVSAVDHRRSVGPSTGLPDPFTRTLADGVRYVAEAGAVVARDLASDEKLWAVPVPDPVAVLTPAPGRLYVLTEGGSFLCLATPA
jgi:hypothetical protein